MLLTLWVAATDWMRLGGGACGACVAVVSTDCSAEVCANNVSTKRTWMATVPSDDVLLFTG